MVIVNCRLKIKIETKLRREIRYKFNLESLKEDTTGIKYEDAVNKNVGVEKKQNSRAWERIKDGMHGPVKQNIGHMKNARNKWHNE